MVNSEFQGHRARTRRKPDLSSCTGVSIVLIAKNPCHLAQWTHLHLPGGPWPLGSHPHHSHALCWASRQGLWAQLWSCSTAACVYDGCVLELGLHRILTLRPALSSLPVHPLSWRVCAGIGSPQDPNPMSSTLFPPCPSPFTSIEPDGLFSQQVLVSASLMNISIGFFNFHSQVETFCSPSSSQWR